MSVLAACTMAINMARCAVYDLAEEVTLSNPVVELSQFVDDFAQYSVHHSER